MPKYQLPGFKAVRPQLVINILHSYMWTMVIFIGWKRLANYNKIPPKIAVHLKQGSQTQIALWATWGLQGNPRAALWRWRNNCGTGT